jgi:Tol biopolymer transport system component
VAIQIRGPLEDIWIYDLASTTFAPLVTPGGSSQAPVWTTDSRSLVYRGTRQGFRNLYRKAADGSGAEERLTTKTGLQTASSATPDGKWMVFLEGGGGVTSARATLWKVALAGDHELQAIETGISANSGQVSPDGRWIAYESNTGGGFQIWVRPFAAPGTAGARQVSLDGGTASRWSRDGKELYFMGTDAIMAVTVSGDTFSAPRVFANGRYRPSANANSNYDTAKDGRIIHVQPIQPARPQTRIEVVLNGIGAK